MSKTLIVAGGGTGGHVLAGVAIADAWRARLGEEGRVLFVGAQGGIEEKLVPRAGYSLSLLRLGSLNRVSLVRKIKTLFLIPVALLQSAAILRRERPNAVIGVGGYASGPLVLMARVLGFLGLCDARTAILEQNSVPGMTNRILGKVVHAVFSAFPGTEPGFPGKHVKVIGNPTRSAIQPMPSASRDPFTIFIFGGSQGALGMNTLVLEALPHLADLRGRIRFIHQTGEIDFERVRSGHEKAGMNSRVEKFIHDMAGCYAQASLLICRAGSSTMSEIAAVGRATIFVPLPTAADNHQEKNARIYVDAGAAWLLPQRQSKGEDLARIIREALADPARLERMETGVMEYYRPHAASDAVSELLALMQAGRG